LAEFLTPDDEVLPVSGDQVGDGIIVVPELENLLCSGR
jgi:hypothetical protein